MNLSYSKLNTSSLFKFSKNSKKLFSGYRSIFFYKNMIPLSYKFKKLMYSIKYKSGRNCSGRTVVFTKSSLKLKLRRPRINYSFRRLEIGFISSIFIIPFTQKFISLFHNSNGSYTYLPVTDSSQLFILTRMKSLWDFNSKRTLLGSHLSLLKQKCLINFSFFIIRSLPKNKLISLLELFPGKNIQYVRSAGSKAKIVKMDTRLNTAVVKLPSNIKKVFSIYSIGFVGQVYNSQNNDLKNNKAGYYNKYGKKPKVRGVAMNPVDHPHGGRTKAIKYQRTPWGKTTKYK